jgi:hypothetical protein
MSKQFIDLTTTPGETGREDTQACWQLLVAEAIGSPARILDVGAGLCKGKARMEKFGHTVNTHDLGPGLPVDFNGPLDQLLILGWTHVTAFDVVEHVPEDLLFLRQLANLAMESVFITTPNIFRTGGTYVYHIREYRPTEFMDILDRMGLEVRRIWAMYPEGIKLTTRQELTAREQEPHNFCIEYLPN